MLETCSENISKSGTADTALPGSARWENVARRSISEMTMFFTFTPPCNSMQDLRKGVRDCRWNSSGKTCNYYETKILTVCYRKQRGMIMFCLPMNIDDNMFFYLLSVTQWFYEIIDSPILLRYRDNRSPGFHN